MKESVSTFVSRLVSWRVFSAILLGYCILSWIKYIVFFGVITQLGVRLFWPEGRFIVHERVYSALEYTHIIMRYVLFLQDDLPYPLNQWPNNMR